jgi:hypothetical protein
VKENRKELTTAELFQNKQLNNKDLWTSCALTGRLLQEPIVSDYKGRLYNKESILEWLLTPELFGVLNTDKMNHVTSIKDVVELNIATDKDRRWICPITRIDIEKESTAKRFVYLAECGHVFADSAIRELHIRACPICDTTFLDNNMVVINPVEDGEDIERLEQRMRELKHSGLSHSLKKLKSNKKKKRGHDEINGVEYGKKKSKLNETIYDTVNGISNGKPESTWKV